MRGAGRGCVHGASHGRGYTGQRYELQSWREDSADAPVPELVRGRPTLVLDAEVEASIRRHGRESYPHECCGALIGRGQLVIEAFALPNATEDGPRTRFLVRPADYRAVERRAGELDAELLGFYHSHPDHPARPSQYDLDHAWPVFAYVIVAVEGGTPKAMTSWRLRDDRTAFDEEPVAIEQHGEGVKETGGGRQETGEA